MGRIYTPGAVCPASRRPILHWLRLAEVLRLAAHAVEASGVPRAALSVGGSAAEAAGEPGAALLAGGSGGGDGNGRLFVVVPAAERILDVVKSAWVVLDIKEALLWDSIRRNSWPVSFG